MKTLSFTLLIALVYVLFEYNLNLPQQVGLDVPQGKLSSLSFAPYREGQGPLDKIFPSVAEIDSDLSLMAQKTHNIRTYASAEGTMPEIPALARKHGLTLLQGAWLGSTQLDNAKEIAELIRSANANPDVVKRVIVGNEVLLRDDLKPEQLIGYIREVKRSIKQPVSYADVWSMYMKYPQLIKEVDFVTIHILPYWEDEPIAVELAPAHIERIYQKVRREADSLVPNIPILIGESGWPSAGRQRGYALPGVVNEAKFIRSFIKVATDNHFDYNIVEAINQSWKSELEGVVGANWGLFSVDRKEVFPLVGPVYENPDWLYKVLLSGGLFLLSAILLRKQLIALPSWQQWVWLALMQCSWGFLVEQADFLWYTSYSFWQRLLTIGTIGLNLLVLGLVALRGLSRLSGKPFSARMSKWLYNALTICLIFAAYKTFALGFNGRYISFPSLSVSSAVIGIIGLSLTNLLTTQRNEHAWQIQTLTGWHTPACKWERYLGWLAVSSAIFLIIGEAFAYFIARDLVKDHPETFDRLVLALKFCILNGQLMIWLACLLVLALPYCLNKQASSAA